MKFGCFPHVMLYISSGAASYMKFGCFTHVMLYISSGAASQHEVCGGVGCGEITLPTQHLGQGTVSILTHTFNCYNITCYQGNLQWIHRIPQI